MNKAAQSRTDILDVLGGSNNVLSGPLVSVAASIFASFAYWPLFFKNGEDFH